MASKQSLKHTQPSTLKTQALLSGLLWTLSGGIDALSDPLVSSWYTDHSSRYARIYDTKTDLASGLALTTWTSSGQGSQTLPVYAGVQEIASSEDWLYIKSTGLGSHIMGPWYLDEAKIQDFPNRPSNTAAIYRFPRQPVIPTDKTATSVGVIGYFVDGIAMFDSTDTFSYDTSAGQDQAPGNNAQGDGVWNRDAYINEGVTFDNANAHQAGNVHHYHANPPALRHALGDSVDYDETNHTYTEHFNGGHSPIIGWVSDGLPIYGPYGYADPDPASTDMSVRRMITGYQRRDGSNGSTDLAATGRTTLPEWTQRLAGRNRTLSTSQYGPDVNAQIGGETYILGRYFEDYAYKGDLGLTLGVDFDLNAYNVRFTRTPEFPDGTWAYFTCIEADGTPVFPYNISTHFYGQPSGGNLTSITESVEVHFQGGVHKEDRLDLEPPGADSNTMVLTWSLVEGGSYLVETSEQLSHWPSSGNAITADSDILQQTQSTSEAAMQFFRITRQDVAPYDETEFGSGGGGMGGPGGGGPPPGGPPPR